MKTHPALMAARAEYDAAVQRRRDTVERVVRNTPLQLAAVTSTLRRHATTPPPPMPSPPGGVVPLPRTRVTRAVVVLSAREKWGTLAAWGLRADCACPAWSVTSTAELLATWSDQRPACVVVDADSLATWHLAVAALPADARLVIVSADRPLLTRPHAWIRSETASSPGLDVVPSVPLAAVCAAALADVRRS